jgi:DNA-binding PadR family transcriptional regulator
MTLATESVLRALIQDPGTDRYGMELSAATGLSSGTLHPILARFEALHWVDSSWESIDPQQAGRPRRRTYRINESGLALARVALAEAYARRAPVVGRWRPIGETT